jgi:hypothetical protein
MWEGREHRRGWRGRDSQRGRLVKNSQRGTLVLLAGYKSEQVRESVGSQILRLLELFLRHVWQGSGSSKNGFGSDSFGGVAFLMELESFWKTFGKTASPLGLRL